MNMALHLIQTFIKNSALTVGIAKDQELFIFYEQNLKKVNIYRYTCMYIISTIRLQYLIDRFKKQISFKTELIKYKDKVQNSNVQMVAYNKNNVQIGLILQQTNKERHIRNFSEILLNLTQMAKGMARILAEGHVNLY